MSAHKKRDHWAHGHRGWRRLPRLRRPEASEREAKKDLPGGFWGWSWAGAQREVSRQKSGPERWMERHNQGKRK